MKILALTPLYLPSLGGIEILLGSLVGHFLDDGIETVVLADSVGILPASEKIDRTEVRRLNFANAIHSSRPGDPLRVLKEFRSIYDDYQPDIIHLHAAISPNAWYVDRLFRSLSGSRPPLIVTQHGALDPMDCVKVVGDLLVRADAVNAVSQAALDSTLDFAPGINNHGVIPNGLQDFGTPIAPRAEENGAYKLVAVGRLQREKGFDLAIEALAKVRGAGLNASLTIIGRGEQIRDLAALAQTLGVSSSVRFLGSLDNPATRRMMAGSHLVLVPSRMREGFSLTAAEAAFEGVPVVAADVGGLSETVDHGKTGLIVPPNDAAALAESIRILLENPARRADLGANARTRAVELYGLKQCATRYVDLFRTVRRQAQARRDPS